MLVVINKYLNDVTRTEDGFFIGYIDSAEGYESFLAALKDTGFYFSVRDSEKFKEDGQFLFKCNKSNVPVPFSGSPFRREKNITYQCAYGCQYYGKVKKQKNTDMVLDKHEKKCLRIRNSKKLGCKAKMAAKCIRIYLDYKIASESAHWRLKKEVIGRLKHDLISKDCEVRSLSRYFVKISGADQHCHIPMHPRGILRKKMVAAKNKKVDPIDCDIVGERDSNVARPEPIDDDVQECVSLHGISSLAVKEESANLKEQCRRKNREILSLSHLCNDEEQLKELLAELTKVTEKFNENATQSPEPICMEGGERQAILVDGELCFPCDVPETVVVDSDACLEILDAKTVVADKNVSLEIGKGIYLNGESQRSCTLKKEKNYRKENEEPCSKNVQSKKLQRSTSLDPEKTTGVPKKFNSNLLQSSSGIEVVQSNDLSDDSVIFFIY